jgi:hypothetical protein
LVRLLLNRPVLFFAVVTLALGLLGGLGLIGSRYGPQLVPAGAIGFAYGVALGVFFAAAFFLLRRTAESRWSAKVVGLVGAALVLGLFLLLARYTLRGCTLHVVT